MSLKKKLQRLHKPGVVTAVEDAPNESQSDRVRELRRRMQQMRDAPRKEKRSRTRRVQELWGEVHATDDGPLHLVEERYDYDHQHGSARVAAALGVDGPAVAALGLDDALATLDPSRALFIDTETTGLMGGVGTLPFLIGMGWFENDELVVEQMLLREPGQEGPMLSRLRQRLLASSCIVSYNGKSYDWPLLRSRFIMNRMPVPEVASHVDLLHCTRRVMKRRMPRTRLVHVEEQVLGFYREDDIAGALIPEVYFEYLRGANPGTLNPILEHNKHDIVALAAILGYIGERALELHHDDDPRERLALAELALRNGDEDRALDFANAAATTSNDDTIMAESLRLVGTLLARRGEHSSAAKTLQEALVLGYGDAGFAADVHLALSKVYEHKLKDLDLALKHAKHTGRAEGNEGHGKRLERLQRKRAKAKAD